MTATTATKSISNGVDKTEAIVPVGTKGRKAKDYYNFTSDQMRKDLIRYYCGYKHGNLKKLYRQALKEKNIDCIDWSIFHVVSKRELVAMLTTLELTKMVILPERIYTWAMNHYSFISDSDIREKQAHSILYYTHTSYPVRPAVENRESAISGFDDAQLKALTKDCWYVYVRGEVIEADNTEASWMDATQQSRIYSEKRRENQKNNKETGTLTGIVIPPEAAKALAHELKTLALHALQTSGPDTLPFRMAIRVIDDRLSAIQEIVPELIDLTFKSKENK